jgi:hypothetical protein
MPSFSAIACGTTGDDVFPGCFAIEGDRDDMIEGQSVRRESQTAVLAGIPVSQIYVGSIEAQVSEFPMIAVKTVQSDDGGELHGEGDAGYGPLIFGQDLHLAAEIETDGLLPGNHLERFIAGIQYKRSLHRHKPNPISGGSANFIFDFRIFFYSIISKEKRISKFFQRYNEASSVS